MKIQGRKPKFEDFMPAKKAKKETNPELKEAQLKVALMAMSKANENRIKPDGK